MATLDVLGEDVTREDETEATVVAYERALADIAARGLDSNISVKLSALGLKLDPAHCRRQFGRIVAAARAARHLRAHRHGRFSGHRGDDPDLLRDPRALREGRHRPAGLPAPQRRGRAAHRRGRRRTCGCARASTSSRRRSRSRTGRRFARSYVALVELLLSAGSYVGIATHDPLLVERSLAVIGRLRLPKQAYEFQMLLGVAGTMRRRLVADGQRLRVYVPYGDAWYAYSVRRLKENPSIAGHVVKGLFLGN